MGQEYRANAVITSRAAASPEDRRNKFNPNEVHTINPGEKFDPAEVGMSDRQLRRLAEIGHVRAIGDEGENMDMADTIARIGTAPARVPTTTERDQRSKGAAPQTPGGPSQGNTSPPSSDANREPQPGNTVKSDVSNAPAANQPPRK